VTNLSSVGVDSLDELVEDCSAIPAALRTGAPRLPLPRIAAPWTVNEACVAAVHGLDEYV
jgi:hypothetical protein